MLSSCDNITMTNICLDIESWIICVLPLNDQTTVKKNLPKLACATDDVSCSCQQKRRISSREDLANVAHPAMEQGDP